MLYAKHLIFMGLALLIVPLVALFFAQGIGAQYRLWRPGFSWKFLLVRLALAVALPLLAELGFELATRCGISFGVSRYLSLGLTGGLYGLTFGDADDFPRLGSTLWGVAAGVLTAYLYGVIPVNDLYRGLEVAVFAVLPLLAYRPLAERVRRRISGSGFVRPTRSLLH